MFNHVINFFNAEVLPC